MADQDQLILDLLRNNLLLQFPYFGKFLYKFFAYMVIWAKNF